MFSKQTFSAFLLVCIIPMRYAHIISRYEGDHYTPHSVRANTINTIPTSLIARKECDLTEEYAVSRISMLSCLPLTTRDDKTMLYLPSEHSSHTKPFPKAMGTFSYHEARADNCGGHLASILSKNELDLVISLLPEKHRVWIGGKRIKKCTGGDPKQCWEWTDGSSFNYYEAWHNGQPTKDRMKNRAELKNGSMRSRQSSAIYRAVYLLPFPFEDYIRLGNLNLPVCNNTRTVQPTSIPSGHPSVSLKPNPPSVEEGSPPPSDSSSSESSSYPSTEPSNKIPEPTANESTEPTVDNTTQTPSGSPSDSSSSEPSTYPSTEPPNKISEPTANESPEPTVYDTTQTPPGSPPPSDSSSSEPSTYPSTEPSNKLSNKPSNKPSNIPSNIPSNKSPNKPSNNPSNKPSDKPSNDPSSSATATPTPGSIATDEPTPWITATDEPTPVYTEEPTSIDTEEPTSVYTLSFEPSVSPPVKPSHNSSNRVIKNQKSNTLPTYAWVLLPIGGALLLGCIGITGFSLKNKNKNKNKNTAMAGLDSLDKSTDRSLNDRGTLWRASTGKFLNQLFDSIEDDSTTSLRSISLS